MALERAPPQLRDVSARAVQRCRTRRAGNGKLAANAFSQLSRARRRTRCCSLVQHRAGAGCERRADETRRAARPPMKKKRQITARLYFMSSGFEIRVDQSRIPEIRAELKRVGRLALARKFGGWLPPARRYLKAPKELNEIAGFLWRNEPIIIFERNSDAQSNAKPAATKYLEQFTLEYLELPRTRSITNDLR